MMVSSRIPGLLQTLEEHPGVDDASTRPKIEECLPWDVLERMLGFLDCESLCTARLVSKTFCAAASAHVCSLTLASTSQAVSFLRYPYLRHVTVTHVYASSLEGPTVDYREEESLAQLDPCLRDLATALTVKACSGTILHTRDFLSQAALMPKLRKLELEASVEHEAALLARCTKLEAIAFGICSISVARTIVTMIQLTSIDIGIVVETGKLAAPVDISWLGQATNLRSLQALSIHTHFGAVPLIGNLTGLTGLTVSSWAKYPTCFISTDWQPYSIAPLTRLTRLRSLTIREELTQSNLRIACCLGSGSLLNLELWVCEEASDDCGRFLSHQTALQRLSLHGEQLCNLRHIGAVRIELLQCLKIHDFHVLDAEGLSVLRRATSLTKLRISTAITEPYMGLSQAVARLTQLRSLRLHGYNACLSLDFPLAVSPLTGLTKLMLTTLHLNDGDLRALLVLTGLRNLELSHCRLTDAVVPELTVLTNLSSLKFNRCGVTSLAPVSEVLDPLRQASGLPHLHTHCVPTK